MKILGNARFVYCGKCKEGFVQKIVGPGEVTLVPCECKIEQDTAYIYKQLLHDSNVTVLEYRGKSFESYPEWLNVYNTEEKLVVYENIYKNFLKGTSSKLTIPKQFHYWLTQENIKNVSNRYVIFPIMSSDEQSFYTNFVCHLLIKRLIPCRIISYQELIPRIMDPKKLDVVDLFSGNDVVILTHLFSEDMISAVKMDFKYERICNFLFQLYNSEMVPIVFSEAYIHTIRAIDKTIKEKVTVQRVNSVLDIILNKADTVILRGSTNEAN
jgi:hypothetical protein